MNTFANEQWLKDAVDTSIFNLLLALDKLSANAEGRNKLIRVIRGVVTSALTNGTISPGKALTEIQKIAIADLSGDTNAWYQVATSGFWLNASVDAVAGTASYILIYSKDDVIRAVNGQHALI
jgi:hypothetical protein